MITRPGTLCAQIFALLIAASSAHAGPIVTPGACELAPFFCEFQGEVLDTRHCRCVPQASQFTPPCAMVPSFCERRGRVLDTQTCRCVRPGPFSRGPI